MCTYISIRNPHSHIFFFPFPADPFSCRPPKPNRLVNPAVIKDLKAVVFPERQHFQRSSRNRPAVPGGGLGEPVDSRLERELIRHDAVSAASKKFDTI